MDALVSRSGEVALVIEDGELGTIHRRNPEITIPRNDSELRFLVGSSTILEPLEDVSREEIVRHLRLRSDQCDALDLALGFLDGGFTHRTLLLTALDLEELLTQAKVREHVESVLYAKPLPKSIDAARCLPIAQEKKATKVVVLVKRLIDHQAAIRVISNAWDRIPESVFGDTNNRRAWHQIAVDNGLFRELAIVERTGGSASSVGRILARESGLPNAMIFLHQWIDGISSARAATRPTSSDRQVRSEMRHDTISTDQTRNRTVTETSSSPRKQS